MSQVRKGRNGRKELKTMARYHQEAGAKSLIFNIFTEPNRRLTLRDAAISVVTPSFRFAFIAALAASNACTTFRWPGCDVSINAVPPSPIFAFTSDRAARNVLPRAKSLLPDALSSPSLPRGSKRQVKITGKKSLPDSSRIRSYAISCIW